MYFVVEKINQMCTEIQSQLRMFGINATDDQIISTINYAEENCIQRLKQACIQEQLPLLEHTCKTVSEYIERLKDSWQQKEKEAALYSWDSFLQELEQSIYNYTLALLYRYQWDQHLISCSQSYSGLWPWALNTLSQQQQLEFFEQWGSMGHPYHPNFKAKIGMSAEEVLLYSPEFQPAVNIQWCALHQSIASVHTLDENYIEFISHAFPSIIKQWEQSLRDINYPVEEFYPIPTHPWQLTHKLSSCFNDLLKTGKLIILKNFQHVTKPSMSFRTMMTPEGMHIKLPVGVHTTSAVRTVSPASAYNGSALSRCINEILQKNDYFQNSMYLMADCAGIFVDTRLFPEEARHLSAIIRQSPLDFLKETETAVPFAALFNTCPLTHRPLFIEIMMAAGIPFETYFKVGVHLLLRGQLHLYLKYGIALESHQQNTIIVFKNHQPIKILNRDLGGIRIYRKQLEKSGYCINLFPDSIIESHSIDAVRNKFIHANLQSTIGYWIDLISKYSTVKATKLWGIVKEELLCLLHEIEKDVDPEFLSTQKKALLVDPWSHKCLMRMRLQKNTDYILVPFNNPLSKV